MAKAKKITSDTTITINLKSKNKTYEIDSASVLEITLKNENGGVVGKTYYFWENMLVKKGNDLVIDTFYQTQNYKTKASITTTIKDYFAQTVEHKFIYSSVYAGEETTIKEITPSVNISHAGVFLEQTNDSDYGYITGTTSSDNYTLGQNNSFTRVYDKKGNDTYDIINTLSGASRQISDYSGNDRYYSKNKGRVYIDDYKGKDTYTSENDMYIRDFTGNDTYISKFEMIVFDYTGNDTYTSKSKMSVQDYAGNDTYTVDSSKDSCHITDNSGKDKYTMNQSDRISIQDKGKGNDTYKATDCTGIWYWKEDDKSYSTFTISDEKGNETYDFQNIVFVSHENFDPDNSEYALHDMSGNDKYKLNGCGYFRVLDEKGNDKITIKSSESVYFDDMAGNDKYDVSGSGTDTVTITDNLGKDTYNIKGSYNKKTSEYVYLEKVTIEDSGDGKDKYNIQYAKDFDIHDYSAFACNDSYNIVYSNGDIYDSNGNDTYTISKLRENYGISISDRNSNKDKLILKDVNKNDLFVIADVKKNGNYRLGTLLLFDKKTYGFVEITGYYHTDGSGDIDRTSDGEIETIKAGSKKVNASSADVYGDFNAIRGDVADWLSGGGNQGEFDSVSDLFASADNGAIQTFITAFSNN